MTASGPSILSLFRRLAAGKAIVAPADTAFQEPEFRLAVRRHGLGPLAFDAGLTAFRDEYRTSVLDAHGRALLWREAAAALGSAGIRVAPIKGLATAADLYREPPLRPMSDLDLLVPAADFERAAQALERLGYVRTLGPAVSIATSATLTLERVGKGNVEPLDLHATILHPLRCRLDLAAVWARARPGDGEFSEAWRLDPVDEALFHFAHAARHELALPLISYLDGVRYLERIGASGREALLGRARESRLGRAVGLAVSATEALRDGRDWAATGPIVSRLLPGSAELADHRDVSRLRQLGRKIVIAEGGRELLGLAVIAWRRRWIRG